MITVSEDFRLDDGNQTVSLADSCVPGESPSILLDGLFGRASICNFKDGSPLGKPASESVVVSGHFGEGIESLGGGLSVGVFGEHFNTLIDFDSWDDSSFEQELNKVLSVLGGLLALFSEENDTTDVFIEVGGGEEQFSVGSSAFLIVLDFDG